MIGQRRLFPALHDLSIRDGINHRIKQLRGRIPSFFTFFKDAKYLEAIVISLRPLLPPTQDGPFREAFFRRFTNRYQGGIKVQTGDQTFQFYRTKPEECKLLAYFTLSLAAMRDFPTLSQITPRQSPGHEKPQIEDSRDECLTELAILASDLGFASNEINRLITADPDLTSAKAFLHHHRPPDKYKIDEQIRERAARNIVRDMQLFATRRTERSVPEFSSQLNKIPKRLRCGIPDNNSFRTTRNCLFLPIIYHYDPLRRSHLAPLAIQRDIFVCFFGKTSLQELSSANPMRTSDDGNDHENLGPVIYAENACESTYSNLRNVSCVIDSTTPTSSNYETRTSIGSSSHRISNFQNYVQDIEAVLCSQYQPSQSPRNVTAESAVGGFEEPLAPGFEQSTGSSMNVYRSLRPGLRPSAAMTEFLCTEHSLIVIFLWSERKFIKFLKTDQDQFEDSVRSLADERFCFMTMEDSRICFHELSDLWVASQEAKLVFANTRKDMAHYTADDSQIAFFDYLDTQYLMTPI